METEWPTEAQWLEALMLQQSHLRQLQSDACSSARELEDARRRIERT